MLLNYLKIAFRVILRNKTNSILNILGLTLGIACFILIQLYVYHELSYDRYFPNSKAIYRMAIRGEMSGFSFESAVMGGPLGHIMREEIPEVTRATRFYHMPRPILLKSGDRHFYQEHILFVDTCFFELFPYELLRGQPENLLAAPYTMVITESAAERLFGKEDPVGKTIIWNNQQDYTITGVMADPGFRSHLNFEFLASYRTLLEQPVYKNLVTTFFAFVTYNYIMLDEYSDPALVEKKIGEIVEKYMGEGMKETGSFFEIFLQPVTDIHLHSHLVHELEPNGRFSQVYIFSGVSLLILLIACINFINLTTARSSARALEIGIRKALGAGKGKLMAQFLSESMLFTLAGLLFAILLVELILPKYYQFSGIDLPLNIFKITNSILFLAGLAIVVGILSGFYPSLFMARFHPIRIIKGSQPSGSRKSLFRNGMVILQLVVTIFLIFNTLLIYRQVNFIRSMDIGVNKDELVVIPLRDREMTGKRDILRSKMEQIQNVRDVTFFSGFLGNFQQRRGFFVEDHSKNDMWMLHHIEVDQNYIDMMEIRLLTGRNFRPDSRADSNSVIINMAMMEQAGWENPLGKKVILPDSGTETPYEVIGVVENFNYASVHDPVESLLIFMNPLNARYLGLRIHSEGRDLTMESIAGSWASIFPQYPFDYFYQDDFYDNLYKAEYRMGKLFIYFTILALMIASLGLFGLVIFTLNQRVKEIGIRKAMGGSSGVIFMFLLKEYILFVVIASVIGWPVSWYFSHRWLQQFSYKTDIPWWIFGLSALIALVISFLTVSWQTLRLAKANPVEALRYE